jgi:hypothetical protein
LRPDPDRRPRPSWRDHSTLPDIVLVDKNPRVASVATLHLNGEGNGEVEGRAMRRAEGHPLLSTMRFNDRSADRKSDAKSIGLGREEGFEDALRDGRIEPRAGIVDRNLHPTRIGKGD